MKSYWNFDILLWDTCRPSLGGGSYDAHHQGAFKMLGLVLIVCHYVAFTKLSITVEFFK